MHCRPTCCAQSHAAQSSRRVTTTRRGRLVGSGAVDALGLQPLARLAFAAKLVQVMLHAARARVAPGPLSTEEELHLLTLTEPEGIRGGVMHSLARRRNLQS